MKIVCKNINRFGANLFCHEDCPHCHGQGFTEEDVVRVSEVEKYVMEYETWSETVMGVPVFYVYSDGIVKWLNSLKGETK